MFQLSTDSEVGIATLLEKKKEIGENKERISDKEKTPTIYRVQE